MSKFTETIKALKDKREKMIELQKQVEIKRLNNDTGQFYEDGLKLNNVNDGMVIIITKNEVIKGKALGGLSHRKVAQDIFDSISDKHIDFGQVNGDFGDIIPLEYGCIFIRMASVLNGPTIIYYPEDCNEFQIEKLIEFNDNVKKYNALKKDEFKVTFEYNGINDTINNDLDKLIEELKSKKIIKK